MNAEAETKQPVGDQRPITVHIPSHLQGRPIHVFAMDEGEPDTWDVMPDKRRYEQQCTACGAGMLFNPVPYGFCPFCGEPLDITLAKETTCDDNLLEARQEGMRGCLMYMGNIMTMLNQSFYDNKPDSDVIAALREDLHREWDV